jgi:hypothetical protein
VVGWRQSEFFLKKGETNVLNNLQNVYMF